MEHWLGRLGSDSHSYTYSNINSDSDSDFDKYSDVNPNADFDKHSDVNFDSNAIVRCSKCYSNFHSYPH